MDNALASGDSFAEVLARLREKCFQRIKLDVAIGRMRMPEFLGRLGRLARHREVCRQRELFSLAAWAKASCGVVTSCDPAVDVPAMVDAPHAREIQESQTLIQPRIFVDGCRMAAKGQADELSAQRNKQLDQAAA